MSQNFQPVVELPKEQSDALGARLSQADFESRDMAEYYGLWDRREDACKESLRALGGSERSRVAQTGEAFYLFSAGELELLALAPPAGQEFRGHTVWIKNEASFQGPREAAWRLREAGRESELEQALQSLALLTPGALISARERDALEQTAAETPARASRAGI